MEGLLDSASVIPIAVVVARLVVPLFIPAYPLPAILVAMVLDAVDQTIFAATLNSDLAGYQTYDKALDIYYLAIAYVSTIANWVERPDLRGRPIPVVLPPRGRRPVRKHRGAVVALRLPEHVRVLLRRDRGVPDLAQPVRTQMRAVVGIAAFIWIFIKLPQEWWIHIAQLDFTDFMKETVFGVPATSSWTDAIAASPMVAVGLVVAAILLIAIAWWAARRFLPPADWPPTVSSDRQAEHLGWPPRPRVAAPTAAFDRTFVEKVILLSLMVFIFSRMLPGTEGSPLQVGLAVLLIIGASTAVSSGSLAGP